MPGRKKDGMGMCVIEGILYRLQESKETGAREGKLEVYVIPPLSSALSLTV